MSYFKDLQDRVYWLDNDIDIGYLPPGSVLITNEEAYRLQNPPLSNEEMAKETRDKRNLYLTQCDKATTIFLDQLAMAENGIQVQHKYTEEQYKQILVIKQQLRDITLQSTFPSSVVWPDRPDWL